MLHSISFILQFSCFITAWMVRISQRHLVAGHPVAWYKKPVASIFNVAIKKISHTAMSHHLRNMFLVMCAVGCFWNPKFRTSFGIGSRNDSVEPLLVAVDPKNLRIRFQTPTGLNMPAERNLLQLIFGGQPWLYVFSIKGICVVRVQPFRYAGMLAPIINVNS